MDGQREYGTWCFCAWMGPVFASPFNYSWGWLGHNFPPFQLDVPTFEDAAG
jgi:hypothetical protein